MMIKIAWQAGAIEGAGLITRSNFGICVFPKDTLICGGGVGGCESDSNLGFTQRALYPELRPAHNMHSNTV